MYLETQTDLHDALTGLLNRKSFYADMESRFTRYRGVISLDMNGLKKINDEQGHAAGDKAISLIAATMVSSPPASCTA